jgi:hypothetical protein
VHAFAELGLLGGGCFVSLVYLAIAQLRRLKGSEQSIEDPEMRRLRPYLLGIVCGFCAGIMSLSRVYIVPTYMVFGLAAAFLNQVSVPRESPSPVWHFNSSLFMRLAGISVAALMALEVGSRLMVRWEG